MKNLLNTLLVIAFPIFLTAQTSIGIKAGANFSNFSMSSQLQDDFNSNLTPGFQVGGVLDIPFGGMFGVMVEGLYTRRGDAKRSKVDFAYLENGVAIDQGILKVRTHLNYVDIPIHLKYNFRGRSVSTYLMAGPQLSFALGGENNNLIIEGSVQDYTLPNQRLEFGSGRNDDLKSSDFGISLGAGMAFELDMGSITLDARYFLGMTNLANSSNPADAFKNRTIMINVGYLYPLGGY